MGNARGHDRPIWRTSAGTHGALPLSPLQWNLISLNQGWVQRKSAANLIYPTTRSSGHFSGNLPLLLHQTPGAVRPDYRYCEEHGVDAIQHASVAGKDGAGIFYSGSAFYQGLDQVS